jgi:hypothetical protein
MAAIITDRSRISSATSSAVAGRTLITDVRYRTPNQIRAVYGVGVKMINIAMVEALAAPLVSCQQPRA